MDPLTKINKRARIVLLAFFLWIAVVVIRLYYLQIINHDTLSKIASSQYEGKYFHHPIRGSIYDRNYELLAGSIETMEENGLRTEQRRYPAGVLAAHLIGFVGKDCQGLAGVEYFCEDKLKKKPFWLTQQKDALGHRIYLPSDLLLSLPVSKDIVLSLDRGIQYIAEKELELQVYNLKAKAGIVIIMDPFSGEILAMAIRPSFNPSHYQNYPTKVWRNIAITDIYEPGSTFKLIPLAAALEESLVSAQDLFYCGNGKARFDGIVIHDINPYGWLSVKDIIAHSSNIGSIKISQRLGKYRLYEYIEKFGFGNKTGIDLPGESQGIVRPPKKWSRVSLASITIGHEIGVTPIQLLRAYAVIANGGYLVRPKVIRYILDNQHQPEKISVPLSRQRILSSTTCEQITSILVRGVEEGTGKKASLTYYTVAGKTGTAEKFDFTRKSYSNKKVVTSFVGFTPAYRPKIVMLVMLDEPKEKTLGGTAAAPVFGRVAQQVLTYLRVPPDKETN
jgi:cell division protein FtsI/penicillin-binding protein 2